MDSLLLSVTASRRRKDPALFDLASSLGKSGHLWSSASDGIHCFHPDGTRLGKILVPEVVANLCFGGVRGNRLLITATTSVYEIAVNAKSAI